VWAVLTARQKNDWRAENIEVPPFVEVLFRKNFPKIAAIFAILWIA